MPNATACHAAEQTITQICVYIYVRVLCAYIYICVCVYVLYMYYIYVCVCVYYIYIVTPKKESKRWNRLEQYVQEGTMVTSTCPTVLSFWGCYVQICFKKCSNRLNTFGPWTFFFNLATMCATAGRQWLPVQPGRTWIKFATYRSVKVLITLCSETVCTKNWPVTPLKLNPSTELDILVPNSVAYPSEKQHGTQQITTLKSSCKTSLLCLIPAFLG